MVGASLGPTTVGQSDPTKLNMTKATVASSFIVSNPAAGTDASGTVSVAGVLQTIHLRLVTSATSANRTPTFYVADPSSNILYRLQAFTQTAGLTIDYHLGLALPAQAVASPSGIVLGPIPSMAVGTGWLIGVATSGLQAGDQWSQFYYSLQSS